MTDYYDGPRRGVADFEGHPHFYDSEWDDDTDEFADTFKLTPVTPESMTLALEDWAIWLRWETAFHAGRADLTTHPALPGDRERHEELKPMLARLLVTNPESHVRARGEFRPANPAATGRGWRPLEVSWQRR
jgi:hypothetical protein